MDELDVEQRSKLRSPPPPPPSQHQDEEGELEDDEIDNDLDVEIADIAEQKKLAMEDLDKNSIDEKSKSHLLHSASFYGYTGPICPQTPSKKANKEEKKEEEVEDGEWAGWEEEEEEGEHLQTGPGGHGRLMERSDTKYCLIVSSDYRLTPRKIPLSPAASSFLVEEEEEEDVEVEVEWEIDEAFKEEESEELLKPSTELILVDSHEDSNEIKETNEGQIVPVEEKGNSERILSEDECDSSSASGGEEEEESEEKANSNGPKKNQTEHRLVVKKDKMARGILMMIPLETIRKRRKQQAQQDCLEDILNYV